MTTEKIIEIFETTDGKWEGDKAFQGLQILSKYSDDDVLKGANHDVIYSIDLEEAIKNGISEEDVVKLALLNWHLENDEYFSCFV